MLSDFLTTCLQVLHIFVCAVLMFVVLLQQGKGGGMGSMMGGGAAQVFGGRGAGNLLTRATAIAAMTFMLTSVALAAQSTSRDHALKARQEQEEKRHADKPAAKPASAPSAAAAPVTSAPTTPAPVTSAPTPAPSP